MNYCRNDSFGHDAAADQVNRIQGRQMHADLTPMMPAFLGVITLFAHSALCLFSTIQFI